jgi:acyl-CoA hydrolase
VTATTAHRPRTALAAVLEPGQDIVIGQGNGVPGYLIRALAENRERLAGSRIFVGLLPNGFPELPGTEIRTFFPSGPFGTENGMARHGVRYTRQSLYTLASGLRSGAVPVDVVLGQATPPRDGRHSLGVAVDYLGAAIERADVAVLEVGAGVPWTGAASTVPAGAEVLTVDCDARPLVADRVPSVGDAALAAEIAAWIPDGATIELGMGRWVLALIQLLAARRQLRLHTGLLGDWVVDLHRAGALDSSAPIVATAAAGSSRFYRWLQDSGLAELAPADLTHDPQVLRALPRFRAVNSVLEVDLLGRANSEVGAGGRRGGVGGLRDFATGAARNPNGLSIVALPATAGERSRVVAALEANCVSLPSDAVDVIVTEHGSVDLRGCDEGERVLAMLRVAAPAHRSALEREARERGLL